MFYCIIQICHAKTNQSNQNTDSDSLGYLNYQLRLRSIKKTVRLFKEK